MINPRSLKVLKLLRVEKLTACSGTYFGEINIVSSQLTDMSLLPACQAEAICLLKWQQTKMWTLQRMEIGLRVKKQLLCAAQASQCQW